MHKFSWAALGAQLVNLAALATHFTGPQTSVIIGAALTIVQAVFPSISKTVNAKAVEQAAP